MSNKPKVDKMSKAKMSRMFNNELLNYFNSTNELSLMKDA